MKGGSVVFIYLALLLAALVVLVPAVPYFRDSGEFVVAAAMLDVSHPAGFPFYAQAANLITLVPFGGIAWRVNCFSALILVITFALTWLLTILLIRRRYQQIESCLALVGLIPPTLLLLVPTLLKQAFVAEVYLLNALFIALLLLCYLRYQTARDLRYLVLAGFIAGVGLGNHLALGLVLLPWLLVLLTEYKSIKRALLPALAAGMVGLAVYAYIPVRAQAGPPLNTGQASNFSRFVAHVSDLRDRRLRGEASAAMNPVNPPSAASAWLGKLENDAIKLSREFPFWILSLAGFLALADLRWSIIVGAVAAGNWVLFKGWNPDPWMPIFLVLALLAAFPFGYVLSGTEPGRRDRRARLYLGLLLAVVLLVLGSSPELRRLPSFDQTTKVAGAQLRALPLQAVYLSENSWFLFKYLQVIEGVRTDLLLLYKQDLLFPEYFKPISLVNETGQRFAPAELEISTSENALTAPWQRFRGFLDFATPSTIVAFEPSFALNNFFKAIARLNENGVAYIQRGLGTSFDAAYTAKSLQWLLPLRAGVLDGWDGFHFESSRYLQEQLVNTAQLVDLTGHPLEAIDLVANLCMPLEGAFEQGSPCGFVPLHNMAVYCIHSRKFYEAASLLLTLSKRSDWQVPELITNLVIAFNNLTIEERAKIREGFSDHALLGILQP